MKFYHSCKSKQVDVKPSNGLTLIEVVAALSLLAMVTTISFVGFERHATQIQRGQEKLVAVEVADQLLRGWYAQGQVPVNASGIVTHQNKRLLWQTRLSDDPSVARIGANKCRLTICKDINQQGSNSKKIGHKIDQSNTESEEFSLVTIELLVDLGVSLR